MATGNLPAAGPHALFEALLSGDDAWALMLLRSSASGAHLSHTGPRGITTVHAALVGGCATAEALASLVAAGAPVDTKLEVGGLEAPLKQFVEGCVGHSAQASWLWSGHTALATAARCALSASSPWPQALHTLLCFQGLPWLGLVALAAHPVVLHMQAGR
jgi:hypothetical protein